MISSEQNCAAPRVWRAKGDRAHLEIRVVKGAKGGRGSDRGQQGLEKKINTVDFRFDSSVTLRPRSPISVSKNCAVFENLKTWMWKDGGRSSEAKIEFARTYTPDSGNSRLVICMLEMFCSA
jgi:hypothetical protein